MAMLVDQGLLDFTKPVSAYWPEFVGADKDMLTVADVMRHEGGLAQLNVTLSAAQLETSALQQNSVGRVLEQHPLRFPEGDSPPGISWRSRAAGSLMRFSVSRQNPATKPLGDASRAYICEPLGVDIYFHDVTEDEARRVLPGAAVRSLTAIQLLAQCLRPGSAGPQDWPDTVRVISVSGRVN